MKCGTCGCVVATNHGRLTCGCACHSAPAQADAVVERQTLHPHDPRERIRKLNRIITGWQKHAHRMGKILGSMDIQDELEEAAQRLQDENRKLDAQVGRLSQEINRLNTVLQDLNATLQIRTTENCLLREALEKWKCWTCGGRPTERYGNPCEECGGDGLHPIASAALEEKTNG